MAARTVAPSYRPQTITGIYGKGMEKLCRRKTAAKRAFFGMSAMELTIKSVKVERYGNGSDGRAKPSSPFDRACAAFDAFG
jgi:hypothetical protein